MAFGAAHVAQQPHAAIGELNKVHAPHRTASFGISDYTPKVRSAVADARRWATGGCFA
jgi:hypothetical protein